MHKRFYRTGELTKILGISRSTLHKWTKTGLFPKPFKLGTRAVGWSEVQIQEWVDTREPSDTFSKADTE